MDVLIERMWERKHGGAPEEDEELIAALASIGRKGKGRGPGRAAARADDDDDDDDMGGDGDDMELGGIGALKHTYRAARPVLANKDSRELDLDEEAAMGLGLAAAALAKARDGPRRRGGAKAAVKDDDGDGNIGRDDGDTKIEIGFGWVTHGAAPNQVHAPEEEWEEVDEEELERTVCMLRLHPLSLLHCPLSMLRLHPLNMLRLHPLSMLNCPLSMLHPLALHPLCRSRC